LPWKANDTKNIVIARIDDSVTILRFDSITLDD